MRVRIHLNLGAPAKAESAVKVQTPRRGWVTVAYAQQITLAQAEPMVDHDLRERVRLGEIKKVPHAFIEGELVSFQGRWRPKAPPGLQAALVAYRQPGIATHQEQPLNRRQVGYNPRVATCFYASVLDHDPAKITEQFLKADRLEAIGWGFYAIGGTFRELALCDRCAPEDLNRTSTFEKGALVQGWAMTQHLMSATIVSRRHRPH